MKKFLLVCFSLVFIVSTTLLAQDRVISGKVTSSEDGTSLPGVNVVLKGTTNGAVTDVDGSYKISVPGSGGTLVFSFIGFASTEVEIGDRTTVDVQMSQDITQLSEVVVTALGIAREKKTLAYAAQDVKAENLAITQTQDLTGALSGKIAGVQILGQAGSKLGQFGNIRIRGAVSLTQDKNPLIILDGMPVPDMNDIDVNNVESINVLKGPTASALYGQRADAGVVVITSKKGKRDTPLSVELNTTTTFDKVGILPKMQNLYGGGYEGEASFGTFDYNQGADNGDGTFTPYPSMWSVFDGKRYTLWDNNYADESWGAKFDGQDYVPWYAWWPNSPYYGQTAKYSAQPNNIRNFYQTGVSTKNTVLVNGGGNNFNVSLSYSNFKQKGITPNTDYTKNYLMANMDFNASKKLKFITNLRYTNSETTGIYDDGYGNQTSGSFNSWFNRQLDIDKLKELSKLTTPDGYSASWNWWGPDYYTTLGGSYKKPAFWFNHYTFLENYKQKQYTNNLSGSLRASYSLTDDLTANVSVARNYTEYKRDYFVPFFLANSGAADLYNPWSNSFGRYRRTESENNYSADLQYKKKFSNLDIFGLVGTNLRVNEYQRIVADMPAGNKTGGLIIPDVYTYGNAGIAPPIQTFQWKKQVNSIYGNVSLGYKGMIYIDGSLRRDWDSALPATKNGYTYGSIGGNFIFSEVVKSLDWLSFGKIRGSWAKVGNDVTAQQLNPVYRTSSQPYSGILLAQTPTTLVDPNLKSPFNTAYEGGFDLKFINRIGLLFTYYKEERRNDIVGISIPSATGYSTYQTNAGRSNRHGIEIALDGDILKSADGLNWNILFNFAKNISEVTQLPAGQNSLIPPLSDGAAATGAFGFVGVVHQLGSQWGQLRGTAIKRDANGTPILNPTTGKYEVAFNQYLGSILPKFQGGIVNRFGYKGASLVVSIDYQKGAKFFSLTEQWGTSSGLLESTAAINDKGKNVRDDIAEGGGVHVQGVDASGNVVDKYVDAHLYNSQFYANRLAEPFVHNGDYMKLREISLSYDLKRLIKLPFIKGLTISAVGRNLALLAVAKDNVHRWDISTMSQLYGENGQLPNTRSYGFNLSVKF